MVEGESQKGFLDVWLEEMVGKAEVEYKKNLEIQKKRVWAEKCERAKLRYEQYLSDKEIEERER